MREGRKRSSAPLRRRRSFGLKIPAAEGSLREVAGADSLETCGKVFKSKVGYSRHIKMHLREQSNSDDFYHHCDKCDKKFASSGGLQHHIKSAHEDFEYKCSSCPMVFKTINKLKAHKNIAHSTDEKYQCKHCGKRSGSIIHLKSHELIHELTIDY